MKIKKERGIYIENQHKMKDVRLSDKDYAMASGAMISVCADTIIVDKKNKFFYFPQRSVKPMKGYWNIGGRRRPGESIAESTANNFNRETSLSISPKRFKLVNTIEAIWKDRKEKPSSVGKHDLTHISIIELTKKEFEIAKNNLDPKEYCEKSLEPFDRKKIIQRGLHKALLDTYDIVFPKK